MEPPRPDGGPGGAGVSGFRRLHRRFWIVGNLSNLHLNKIGKVGLLHVNLHHFTGFSWPFVLG